MTASFRHLALVLCVASLALWGCDKFGVDRRDEHGMTALMYAAKNGDRAEVERLLQRGANVNAKVPTRDLREFIAFISWMQQLPHSDIGYTALMYAAQGGHRDAVEVLISKGADVNIQARTGETAFNLALWRSDLDVLRLLADAGARIDRRHLVTAISFGSPDLVEFVLSRAKLDHLTTKPGDADIPVLILAVRRRDPAIVKLLLDAGADPHARDSNGWSALRWAAKERQPEIVRLLEDAGVVDDFEVDEQLLAAVRSRSAAQVEAALARRANSNTKDSEGIPPLFYAARAGDDRSVALLLEAGANPNVTSPHDGTPLIAAATAGHRSVAERLLAAGADVRQRDHMGQTPLYWATNYGHEQIATLLLSKGADANDGSLAVAALRGQLRVVEALLTHGVDLAQQGRHALYEGARGCNDAVIIRLLEAGADPRQIEPEQSTPLHRAASHCGPAAIKQLVLHGANVNARELNGYFPLQFAALSGKIENVKVLLDAGADVHAKDDEGKSAMDAAKEYPEVQEVLRRAGAR